jgi:alginate O-acetyltransferase complex protein AlgI
MTLVSPGFALFLCLVFFLHWFIFKKNAGLQNLLLLASGLFFYGLHSWTLLGSLIVSILVNFYTGRFIGASQDPLYRKAWMAVSLVFNLSLLLYFKYFLFLPFGSVDTISIVVPLGISFYTLQLIGYAIDIYNEEIKPEVNLVSFATYVAYFPKIIAGPIEPARKFLPQIAEKRKFNYQLAVDGVRQFLWGLFIKLVIANNADSITTDVFHQYKIYPASTLLLTAFLYIFQVYCDFAGYSNMAIGISKLFGIQLSRNFHAPFFSTNISQYWRKWHMTLTGWMMKYVFNPLAFALRQYKKMGLIVAIIITFTAVGLWHGPRWTFIVFGFLHSLYFIPLLLFPAKRQSIPLSNNVSPRLTATNGVKMLGLFLLIMVTCIFFGSRSIYEATDYISRMFSIQLLSLPVLPPGAGWPKVFVVLFFIILMLITEWKQKDKAHELEMNTIQNPWTRRLVYLGICVAILLTGSISGMEFIYAQF